MPDLFDISLDGEPARRIASVVGARPVSLRRVSGGCTPAGRFIATFAGGESLFAKIATNELTAGWLRDEHNIPHGYAAAIVHEQELRRRAIRTT